MPAIVNAVDLIKSEVAGKILSFLVVKQVSFSDDAQLGLA